MTTKVVKGSIWTLAGQVMPLGVSLVTMPLVIRLLGSEAYGVLILVGLVPTFLGFADFGMSMASTRFASEAYGDGDPDKEAAVIRTAAVVCLSTSVPIAVLVFLFSTTIISYFNVPESLNWQAILALRIASLTFVLSLLCGIFNTPQLTRLRMDLNTLVNSGFRILGLIATPVVLYFGFGVLSAVTVLFGASLFTLVGHLIVSRKLLPELFGLSVDRDMIRPLLSFGGAIAVGGIAAMFLLNGEKGIVSAIISVKALAYYSVAYTLASMLILFASSMVQSLLPAFSQLQGEGKREQFNSLFAFCVRVNILWLLPAIAILTFGAKSFFSIWAGEEFGVESSIPFYILSAGLAFGVIAYIPSVALMASNRAALISKMQWAELIPYLLLVWYLTANYGIAGTAAALSIRAAVDFVVISEMARHSAQASVIHHIPLPLAIAAIPLLLPVIYSIVAGDQSLWTVSAFVAGLIIYVVVAWSKVLTSTEVDWVLLRFRRLRTFFAN